MNFYFCRKFIPVQDPKKDIASFVQLLRKQLLIQQEKQHLDFVEVRTERFILFLYYPKTVRAAESQDQTVIHIDYDQLMTVPQKIINRIRGLQGLGERIYARSTVVARIDKGVSMAFQEEHHLQGAIPGKYRYGLFHQGELVSVAVFSGGRIMQTLGPNYRSFELIRFCHKGDVLVVGGLSKLLKSFIKDFAPQDIMTYTDRDWSSDDSSLQTIGFKPVGFMSPLRFAIIGGRRQLHFTDLDQIDYYVENMGSLKLKLIL